MDLRCTTTFSLGAILLLLAAVAVAAASAEYPGVIELVGYSNRRARTHFLPLTYSSTAGGRNAPREPSSKMLADIETVKQNIEKYNKLLTLDTRDLPASQKDMLNRIVERVARLKETLDIEEHQTQRQQNATSASPLTAETETETTSSAPSTMMEAETDPTLVLDETTLLHLQTSMDELAAAQAAVTAQTTRMRDMPTSSTDSNDESDSNELTTASTTMDPMQTDPATAFAGDNDDDETFVAARANNNNIAAITADDGDDATSTTNALGNQQRTLTTSGKLGKTRATKRPGGSSTKTSTTSKRGQRPANGQHHHQSTTGHNKQTTKQKLAAAAAASAATTTQPLQYNSGSNKQKQQQQHKQQQPIYQQQKLADKTIGNAPAVVGASIASSTSSAPTGEQRTSPSPVAGIYGASSQPTNSYNDIVYDEHVNTSSIIDSLNNAREEFYQHKQTVNINNNNNNKDKKPSSATAKPTKYHYYPHNQHIYLLPECAIQQVCNAVYVRLNYTQPLCACPSRYRDPCSASLNEDDQHTTKLVGDGKKKAITLAKTCEATTEMRECRSPKDWSLLALQNTRTGKSHYLVICRCPDHFKMEGPMAHDQPTYASVPGIRVFGMMCVKPGYSVRKPSVQPPKRYQLQKPFYRPNSQGSYVNNNQYIGGGSSGSSNSAISSSSNFNKDTYGRPIYGGASSTSAFSSGNGNIKNNYQDSSSIINSNNGYQSQNIISQQQQQQPSYQYLNRPESIHSSSSNLYRPDTIGSINNFPGAGSIYGRNNERQGEAPIEAQPAAVNNINVNAAALGAVDEDGKILISTSTQPTEESRTTLMSSTSASSSEVTINKNSASSEQDNIAAETQNSEESKLRERRSIVEDNEVDTHDNDIDAPEFPWDRVLEFQKTILWD